MNQANSRQCLYVIIIIIIIIIIIVIIVIIIIIRNGLKVVSFSSK